MNITFINCTINYPYSFSANNSKIGLFAKGIKKVDKHIGVTVINTYFGKVPQEKEGRSFCHDGISVLTYKNLGNKILMLIKNTVKTLKYIANNKEDKRILILCGGHFLIQNLFTIFARYKGYKVGYIYQEWHRGFKESSLKQLNYYLMDTLIPKAVNFVLPISEFLIEKTKPYNNVYFKLPIIGNFDIAKVSDFKPFQNNYFVYCASIAYYDVATLIVDAFSLFLERGKEGYSLCLVLYGDKAKINQLTSYIELKNLKNHVVILASLSDEDLFACYCNASALLIPLNPDVITEKARFSQQIAEYLSSKRSIITTPVGEINHYFKDKENLIVTDYSIEGFYGALKYVSENESEILEIGSRGYEFGKKNFSYVSVAKDFLNFLYITYP